MKKTLTFLLLLSCILMQAQDDLFHQYKVIQKEVVFNNSKPIEFKGDKYIFIDLDSETIIVSGETDSRKTYTRKYNVYQFKEDFKHELRGVIMNTIDENKETYNWHIYSGHEFFYCVKPGEPTIIERFKIEKL